MVLKFEGPNIFFFSFSFFLLRRIRRVKTRFPLTKKKGGRKTLGRMLVAKFFSANALVFEILLSFHHPDLEL